MALSPAFVDTHVEQWATAMRSSYRPYREKWPSRLFHHAPIENAAAILVDGHLRSRNDPSNGRAKDVAAPGVIDTRVEAHDYGRLYFRPRTPTQWHIEGIRKAGECTHGERAHAPILVMMVFGAKPVLIRPGVRFSDRNMQLSYTQAGETEEYFSAIPFEKVFHEGGINGDRSIIDHRCAEVLVTSPMPLSESLQWIYCRTEAEKDTLLHMLGTKADFWRPAIQISDDLQVFDRRFTFVEKVMIDNKGIVARFNPRQDRQQISIRVTALASDGAIALSFENSAIDAIPQPPATSWRFNGTLPDGRYLVEIVLEGHLAYRAYMMVGQDIFL
ncbi:DUF4433 domain-containing protein [Rhizobium sp. CG4]|uniref:DarT ssDNA thymidine ADP-ribosyltransferase family protein n=1 Tax=Rhizobium sp. CG4 TaxID=2726075 RepID=UPI002033C57F|nr:DarT ssDNA thymidine ADP-ribosyltransferase family protein [Rhizobium sp. CG4]MCM2458839.1 DUF4433 domain-containing protein [Rhizobium sp. CG4]